MLAIHTSMASTLISTTFTTYFEYKTLTMFTLKCTSHGDMYGGQWWALML